MASSSLTSFSLRLATVLPSLGLLTSRSSNRPLKSSSTVGADRRRLDVAEDPLQGLVQVRVALGLLADIDEQVAAAG